MFTVAIPSTAPHVLRRLCSVSMRHLHERVLADAIAHDKGVAVLAELYIRVLRS